MSVTPEILDAMRFERRRIVSMILSVERCMCPYTPGAGLPGWTPNFALGMDGVHQDYCPFGIAKYIDEQPVQRRNAKL